MLLSSGVAFAQSIPSQSPWWVKTGAITQLTPNYPIRLTGLTPGGCLQLTSLNIATTTGSPCGSGSGGAAWPFTPATNFGVSVQSTSTPIWDTGGLQASSTSQLLNLNVYGTLNVGGLSALANATFGSATGTTLTTTGAGIFGNIGGVYANAAGSGVGGIGFNSLPDGSYTAGVAGYGALMQLAPSTGAFTMFLESNVAAGSAHGHTTTLGWDNTGLVTLSSGASTTGMTISTVPSAVWVGSSTGLATAATAQTCTNQFLRAMSATYAKTCATVSLTADVTGTLPVANGGTASTTLTGILLGNGTGAVLTAVNGTNFSLITALDCTGTGHLLKVTAAGVFTCSADSGGGGSGSVSTSTADTINQVAFFGTTNATPALIGGSSNFTFATSTGLLNLTGKLNIATTSTMALNVQDQYSSNILTVNTASTTGDIFDVASSTATILFGILQSGQQVSSTTAPTLSSCGTSPSFRGDDQHFTITVGSVAATGCTATFGTPFTKTPHCVISSQTSLAASLSYTESTSQIIISNVGSLVGDLIDVNCFISGNG